MKNKSKEFKFSNIFMVGLTMLFFVLGYNALQDAQPEPKNERIYKELKAYMPYYLEKRVGGFQIMMKGSKTKEKPPITEVYRRLEQLEKGWGKEFLKIVDNDLIVIDKDGKTIGKIAFHLPEEKQWVNKFFEIK
ncbi:MAG: hypothetical protein DRG78_03255 [Epsilonproteobacteria bacterium]|nr:MAG: hypothetical protein DRG78_03255 [Campylobacterota bacterium]